MDRLCKFCGKVIPLSRGNSHYCTDECMQERKRQLARDKYRARVCNVQRQSYTFRCEFCGEEFETYNNRQVFCCRDCAYESAKEKRKKGKSDAPYGYGICRVCGKRFEKKNSTHKYCSSSCSEKAKRKKQYEEFKSGEESRVEGVRGKSIAEIVKAATKAGMSYGMYVARFGL